jgi:hypothetical protein
VKLDNSVDIRSGAAVDKVGIKWRDNGGPHDMDGEFACMFIWMTMEHLLVRKTNRNAEHWRVEMLY